MNEAEHERYAAQLEAAIRAGGPDGWSARCAALNAAANELVIQSLLVEEMIMDRLEADSTLVQLASWLRRTFDTGRLRSDVIRDLGQLSKAPYSVDAFQRAADSLTKAIDLNSEVWSELVAADAEGSDTPSF